MIPFGSLQTWPESLDEGSEPEGCSIDKKGSSVTSFWRMMALFMVSMASRASVIRLCASLVSNWLRASSVPSNLFLQQHQWHQSPQFSVEHMQLLYYLHNHGIVQGTARSDQFDSSTQQLLELCLWCGG